MTSQIPRSLKVTDVNPHLICVLCGGYYIDATTIIECLHSFCKSCIVRYLETNKYCPICDVLIHKTKPLLNIRPDRTLQSIVYKLIPGLLERELQSRKEFYKQNLGEKERADSPVYLPDEFIRLMVQYEGASSTKINNKRYFNCPAAATVSHLQKLMHHKFNLNGCEKVNFLYDGDLIPSQLSFSDLAYIYHWKRKYPVELEYQLLEYQKKKMKLTHNIEEPAQYTVQPVVPDREVQLQISENGVFSVHSLSMNIDMENDCAFASRTHHSNSASAISMPVKDINPETMELMKSLEKTVSMDFHNSPKKGEPCVKDNETGSLQINNIIANPQQMQRHIGNTNKQKVKNCLLEKEPSEVLSINSIVKNKRDHTINTADKTVLHGILLNQQITHPGAVKVKLHSAMLNVNKDKKNLTKDSNNSFISGEKEVSKCTNSVNYKTLKTSIKQWNPTIPRSTIMTMKQANNKKYDSHKKIPPKSPKFFKKRNIPRFLGNPASGVKPMYQLLSVSEPKSQVPQASASPPIMKIDPKTLRSISSPSCVKLNVPSLTDKLTISQCETSPKASTTTTFTSKTPKTNQEVNNTILPPQSSGMSYPQPDSQIIRAMSMLCSPSAAFHPSLPPSISMLFNPHHPHHRSLQNERAKLATNEFQKSFLTPSVQRVPPSCPTNKHSLYTAFCTSALPEKNCSNQKDQDTASKKSFGNDNFLNNKCDMTMPNILVNNKESETVMDGSNQKGVSGVSCVPLSNELS